MNLIPKAQNQTELRLNDWIVFFSYQTPVVAVDRCNGTVYVTEKKWSQTTTRHINKYLSSLSRINEQKICSQGFLDDLIGSKHSSDDCPDLKSHHLH